MLLPQDKALLALMVFIIMLGMGATLRSDDFRNVFKNPRGVFVGFLSQFGWMPIIAYLLAVVLNLPNYVALSLILLGATPGGTTSNLFTYYSRGSVSLSVSMTVCSTIAAIFMMPLLLGLYATEFAEGLTIPYKNIAGALAMLLIPVAIGMYIRKLSVTWARRIEKLASFTGIGVVLFLVGIYSLRNQELLMDTPPSYYVAAIMLGICGFVLGYLASKVLGLKHKECKTVSLETGIQNGPLTLGIIALTFTSQGPEMLLLPSIYGITIILTASLATLVYRKIDAKEQVQANPELKAS